MSLVNPSSLEIRVEDFEETNNHRPIQLIGANTGTQEEPRNTGGSIIASTRKKARNGIINPRNTAQVLDILGVIRWWFWERRRLTMLMLIP